MPLRNHLKYMSYVVRHKFYVFIECCRYGIPVQGITHDLSKLLPSEYFPYVDFFGGDVPSKRDKTGYYKPTDTGNKAFDFAWLLHQKRNKHHWQWWILPEDDGGLRVLEMPERYCKEMVADWLGAGKAQHKPDCRGWYAANKDKMIMGPETRKWVERELGYIPDPRTGDSVPVSFKGVTRRVPLHKA